MRATFFTTVATLIANTNANYMCLTTKDKQGEAVGLNAHNCDGASEGETLNVFGSTLCCKAGSGGKPTFEGFQCQCPDVQFGLCVDDRSQLLAGQGHTCHALKEKGCETLLSDLDSRAPQLKISSSLVCPRSCDSCSCSDDAEGVLKEQGTNCADILSKAEEVQGCTGLECCKADLKSLNDKVPVFGIFVGSVCPSSCGSCPLANVEAAEVPAENAEEAAEIAEAATEDAKAGSSSKTAMP